MGSLDLFGYKTTGIATYDAIDVNGQAKTGTMDFTGSGFSTRARLNTTFKLDKTFSIQLQGNYRGAQKAANQNRSDMYVLNLGASKTIWKGDGTITFNIQDIFNTRRMESLTFNNDFTRRNYMQWQPRQFSISLSYRFKQGERIEQPKKRKISTTITKVATSKVARCKKYEKSTCYYFGSQRTGMYFQKLERSPS